MNQPQLVTNLLIRQGLARVDLRTKNQVHSGYLTNFFLNHLRSKGQRFHLTNYKITIHKK